MRACIPTCGVCRHHINHIQREDREFLWEGVESLTHEELVEACRDRGMKFYGTTDDAMREQAGLSSRACTPQADRQ